MSNTATATAENKTRRYIAVTMPSGEIYNKIKSAAGDKALSGFILGIVGDTLGFSVEVERKARNNYASKEERKAAQKAARKTHQELVKLVMAKTKQELKVRALGDKASAADKAELERLEKAVQEAMAA
jgi:hypothetical protein